MRIIFVLPNEHVDAINDITTQCGELCISQKKENLSGDQIIAIIAIVTPVVWALVDKYLYDNTITIQIQLDEKTTVTISERSYKRAKMKADKIREEWEKTNRQ